MQEALPSIEEAHQRINVAIQRNERPGRHAQLEESTEEVESPTD